MRDLNPRHRDYRLANIGSQTALVFKCASIPRHCFAKFKIHFECVEKSLVERGLNFSSRYYFVQEKFSYTVEAKQNLKTEAKKELKYFQLMEVSNIRLEQIKSGGKG